ncbi:MAG: hypothetical protein V7L01_06220 [Nostoc sp.]|uniref:hypothetical protein n=1 Tax=Nostoc sp. TaxID=1180 RepID=UPI002FFACFC1
MSEEVNDQTKEINKCLKESTIIAVAFGHCVPPDRLIHQFNEQIPCSKQLNTTAAAFWERRQQAFSQKWHS